MATRLRADIHTVAARCESSVGQQVYRYGRLISPIYARRFNEDFPCGMRRHGTDKTRTSNRRYCDVLCFHIGDAVEAWYRLHRGAKMRGDLARIKFVEDLAHIGPSKFVVDGNDLTGYRLVTRGVADLQRAKRAED